MKKFLLFSAAALALAATLGVAGFAYAQTPTPSTPVAPSTSTTTDQVVPSDQAPGGRGRHAGLDGPMGGLQTYMEAATAEAFGLTTDELAALKTNGQTLLDVAIEQKLTVAEFEAKQETARQNALAAAVADGALTQAQADAMAQRPNGNPLRTYLLAAQAKAFGVTTDELAILTANGQTLKDLAIKQNLTVADFKAKQEAAYQNAIDAALAAGAITQAQADELATRTAAGFGLGDFGFGGGHGGHGGHGGPGFFTPPTTTTQP